MHILAAKRATKLPKVKVGGQETKGFPRGWFYLSSLVWYNAKKSHLVKIGRTDFSEQRIISTQSNDSVNCYTLSFFSMMGN